MDNNERLAAIYRANVRQISVIFPLVWKHEVGGDWYVAGVLRHG